MCVCVREREGEKEGKRENKQTKTSINILFLVYEEIFATRMFIIVLKDWEYCMFKNRLSTL